MIEVWKYPIERINELRPNSIWQLHSEFTNGVNLVDEGGNLLFVGTDKNGELPFGLHLTFRNLVHFKAELNKKTRFHYHELTFINQGNLEYSLSLKKSTSYSVALEKADQLNTEAVYSLFKWASKEEKKRNGFGEHLPTTEFILENWMVENKQAIGYLFSENPVEIERGLRYFIGRGQGLTPSGDDFLVGLLSVEKAFSLVGNQFEIILETFVSQEKLTTDISEAYLQAALKGRFSTSINQLMDVLAGTKNKTALPDILTKIIQNGHTSGIDTLTGILVGLLIGQKT